MPSASRKSLDFCSQCAIISDVTDQSYHIAAFRLLGTEPQISDAAIAAVEKAEKQLDFKLPASARDWYIRNRAVQTLFEHSNHDPPILPEEFASIEWHPHRLLPFRYENQGVCTWAICLDGSEDPPVYVDVDSGGKEWQLLAPTFSSYVYTCVWDYRMIFKQPGVVQAQNSPLSDSALNVLKSRFRQEVETHGWPGDTQYRFANDHGAILIWSGADQADWYVAAPNAERLEVALREVWQLDGVGESLYKISEVGKVVLDRLRR